VPVDEAMWVERLYRERYGGFTTKRQGLQGRPVDFLAQLPPGEAQRRIGRSSFRRMSSAPIASFTLARL
jgi:hypothetical protein